MMDGYFANIYRLPKLMRKGVFVLSVAQISVVGVYDE